MWRLFQVSQIVTLFQPCDQDICNMLRLRCSNIFMRFDSMVTWQLASRAQVFNCCSAFLSRTITMYMGSEARKLLMVI